MNAQNFASAYLQLAFVMKQQRDMLISLDSRNGDGDLGISMDEGFSAAARYMSNAEEQDLGKLMMKCSSAFNEAAPSSLGTILSLGMMGMALALHGKSEITLSELADAMQGGLDMIAWKAGSKQGDKTILDALYPAVDALKTAWMAGKDTAQAFCCAAEAAAAGAESTKDMPAVHGRAVYYKNKSLGLVDGGAVVGKLIFEALANH